MTARPLDRPWLRTFGGLRLESTAEPLSRAANQRHRLALLAVLVATPGNQLSRDRLLALLWPERDAGQARTLLNTAVHAIRKELGPDLIRSVGDTLLLDHTLLDSDLARLQQRAASGRADLAVAEYAGPFLEGFHLSASPEFDEWQAKTQARFHAQVSRLLDDLVAGAGTPEVLLSWTERRARHDPHSARGALGHMRALQQAGDRAAALKFAQHFQQRLAADLDAGPDPTIAALADELRSAQHARPAAPAVPRTPIPPVAAEAALSGTARGAPPRPRPRHWWIGGTLSVAAALAVSIPLLRGASATSSPERTSVAVMPFQVRGDTGLHYLGAGLMDLLSARMNGMGPVTTVDPASVAQLIGSEAYRDTPALAQVRAMATALAADHVVLGSVVVMGDRLDVRAAIYDPQGQREAEVLVTGAPETLPAMVDDLTRRLLAEQLRGTRGPLPSVAALTTESLGALREYLAGEEAFRDGELLLAADLFARAVAIDSAFALGYFRLGQVRNRLPGLHRPWWERPVDQKAVQLASRLPVFERDLVRTAVLPNGEALPILRTLVAARPSSAEAQYRLGVAIDHEAAARGTDNVEAIAALRRAIALDRRTPGATRALAFALARRGEFDEVRRIAADSTTAPSDALLARALLAFGNGSGAEMRSVLRELAVATAPAIEEAAAAVTTLTRRPDRSRPIYELLAEAERPDTVRWIARTRLADLALAEGRWREAGRQVALADAVFGGRHLGKRARMALLPWSPVSAADADSVRSESLRWFARGVSPEGPERSIPGMAYNAGMISASRGDTAGVRQAMRALDGLKGTEYANRLPLLQASLEAEIAWIANQPDRVIELLSNAIDPNANQRYLMARALEATGRLDEALPWYQSYPDLDLNAPSQLGWRAASLLRIADLYAQRGDVNRARSAREEFLRLWGDADAELQPVVDSVRRKLGAVPR